MQALNFPCVPEADGRCDYFEAGLNLSRGS
jgi:hypothetical protein